MAEETTIPEAPRRESLGTILRKLAFTLGVLFVAWILFVQIAPRLMFNPDSAPKSPFTDADKPPAAETAPPLPVMSSAPTPEEKITQRIDAIEARIKALEDVVAATPASGETGTATYGAHGTQQPQNGVPAFVQEARIASIERQIKEQEEAMQTMQAQVEESESKGVQQVAVVTSFTQIKEAAQRGDPFTVPLSQLKTAAPDNAQAPLDELSNYAEKGVAPLPTLKRTFGVAADLALASNDKGSLMGSMRSLIRVRKIGEQQGASDEAVIARAEARLAEDNVDAALKELAALQPPASDAFASWVANAQAYASVRHALAALESAIANPAAASE